MLTLLDPFRDLTVVSIFLRMLLAFCCGGLIGIEREFKRRPAGFRTHILICLGAAATTLTSQYLVLYMHYNTDIARLGAQVVAGVGFIGAGTIIVTRNQRVKGLTTAAGLWTAAIIGLCIGAGFYEGAIYATALVLIAESVFSKLEYRIFQNTPEVNLFVEYQDKKCLDQILNLYAKSNIKINNMEITRQSGENHDACAIFTLRLPKNYEVSLLASTTSGIDGVLSVEEL